VKSTVHCSFGLHPAGTGPSVRAGPDRGAPNASGRPAPPCAGPRSPCSPQEVCRRAAGAVPETTAASARRPSPSAAPPAASAPTAGSRATAGAGRGFGPKDPPRRSGHGARATCRPSCARSHALATPPNRDPIPYELHHVMTFRQGAGLLPRHPRRFSAGTRSCHPCGEKIVLPMCPVRTDRDRIKVVVGPLWGCASVRKSGGMAL
jgi:hypothetical protein